MPQLIRQEKFSFPQLFQTRKFKETRFRIFKHTDLLTPNGVRVSRVSGEQIRVAKHSWHRPLALRRRLGIGPGKWGPPVARK